MVRRNVARGKNYVTLYDSKGNGREKKPQREKNRSTRSGREKSEAGAKTDRKY